MNLRLLLDRIEGRGLRPAPPRLRRGLALLVAAIVWGATAAAIGVAAQLVLSGAL